MAAMSPRTCSTEQIRAHPKDIVAASKHVAGIGEDTEILARIRLEPFSGLHCNGFNIGKGRRRGVSDPTPRLPVKTNTAMWETLQQPKLRSIF